MANGYVPCKIGGCERPSLGAERGPFAKLCNVHTQEARERRAAQVQGRAPAVQPAPEPREHVEQVETAALNGQLEPRAQRLVALAAALDQADQEVDAANAALTAAQERHGEATAAMKEAIEDLSSHV